MTSSLSIIFLFFIVIFKVRLSYLIPPKKRHVFVVHIANIRSDLNISVCVIMVKKRHYHPLLSD